MKITSARSQIASHRRTNANDPNLPNTVYYALAPSQKPCAAYTHAPARPPSKERANDFDLLTQRTPTVTAVLSVGLFASVFLVMFFAEFLPSYYFDLYSDDVRFYDTYVIDNIYKALVALMGTALLTAVNVYVRRKISAWQINYLNSPHVPRSDLDSTTRIQLTMMLHTVFLSLSSAVNLFFMFSNFWFLVAQTTATIIVTACMTHKFLTEKQYAADEDSLVPDYRPSNTQRMTTYNTRILRV
ncbi:hypothetical protein CYMTET_40929 [Cymbomonas tetramitiformis]|uniref:Uncharacterized protein n=1 Tax=Cymbomonas tetramitiformis TaxID=36881 RepID=A0AAE0C8F6_9CHLO|nr:hypothetical protein CYMTET_40929 [Cymbomonas tetramitiformis]|eukprot:gene227-404_t